MSLTPDEWRELDEALIAYETAVRGDDWSDAADRGPWLRMRIFQHARTLIDAARPKCETCKEHPGNTSWYPVEKSPGVYGWEPCPDCDGTGWAA